MSLGLCLSLSLVISRIVHSVQFSRIARGRVYEYEYSSALQLVFVLRVRVRAALGHVSLPAVDFDGMLAKCAVACELLLRPLNANDMRQMRPANLAYEQFNYGEVFVRRFVSAFKQVGDFRALGQVAQLKLLRGSMVSTLNIGGVFSFDVVRQAWVLQVESCPERVYLVSDMIALFESSGQTHIRDYMQSYCEFHTRLRNEFNSDVILFFVLILIDMFSPHRFTVDSA